jgi:hypothetical protein
LAPPAIVGGDDLPPVKKHARTKFTGRAPSLVRPTFEYESLFMSLPCFIEAAIGAR